MVTTDKKGSESGILVADKGLVNKPALMLMADGDSDQWPVTTDNNTNVSISCQIANKLVLKGKAALNKHTKLESR